MTSHPCLVTMRHSAISLASRATAQSLDMLSLCIAHLDMRECGIAAVSIDHAGVGTWQKKCNPVYRRPHNQNGENGDNHIVHGERGSCAVK
jgi:hypothetical protein